MRLPLALILIGLTPFATLADSPPTVRFDRVVIDPNLADAYQVEVADVDGDGKPDIIALGNNTIAWYQNPTWTKRIIGETKTSPLVADIISSATVDLDGDGKAEVAIACDFAMNTPTRGQLFLASQGATIDDHWTFRQIKDVPSIHRVRWADLEGDRKPELIVAPLFGPNSKPPTYEQDVARVVELRPDPERPKTGDWTENEIMRRPVVHAVKVLPKPNFPPDMKLPGSLANLGSTVITADNTGLSIAQSIPTSSSTTAIRWRVFGAPFVPGASGPAPKRGSSDLGSGTNGQGRSFWATIDPWHGSELVVWQSPDPLSRPAKGQDPEAAAKFVIGFAQLVGKMSTGQFFTRTVIDDTLDEGHALWTADVDGDGTDEIFAGHRGKNYRVAMYRFDGKDWNRTILDTAIAAQDLRGGDLDGDGVPDVVAVGGKTHNVVWYRPIREKPADANTPR